MSIAKNESFPPDQIKEMIGELSVATARSTAPENKISLTSSRISLILGVIEIKCMNWMEPGLRATLYSTIVSMLEDLKEEEHDEALQRRFEYLYNYFFKMNSEHIEKKLKTLPIESLQLLKDYNLVLQCRERWKDASDIYMHNNQSWSISNKIIAEINDKLTRIELDYNLVIKPKHSSYDASDLAFLGKSGEQ
jgi:hypothetical protein